MFNKQNEQLSGEDLANLSVISPRKTIDNTVKGKPPARREKIPEDG